ncbi:MAG: hypothetical protein MK105_12565, partial [Crocinitomicaceae bacterium]|nr:hypothetical protein [Crocinitomicaceae bacterium]
MKRIIQIGIVIIICFSCLSSRAQTSVFNWDVENSHYIQPDDAASFQINYYDEDGLNPNVGSGYAPGSYYLNDDGSGNNDVLVATSWFDSPSQASNWVVFGPISYSSNSIDSFYWEHRIISNNIRDGYEVLVNNVGPTPADFAGSTIIESFTDDDPLTNGHTSLTPQSAQIPPSFAGSSIYIAIHHNANDQFVIAFDNFNLTQTSIASTSSSFTVNQCNSYTVPSGDETYTTSGVYMDTIPNAAGGDSIMTISANILQPSSGTDIQTSCGNYTWIDGNTYSSSNNIATHTLMNSVGCDSVVTLNLTV